MATVIGSFNQFKTWLRDDRGVAIRAPQDCARNSSLLNAYKVIFYKTSQGAEPVREWLQSLESGVRLQLGQAIQVLQMNGPALRMPYACSLGKGLFELR